MNEIDEQKFQTLYERHVPLVYRRCLRYLHDDQEAGDAAQEIFLKLLHHLNKLNKQESVFFWLQKTTTHHCLTLLRNRKNRNRLEAGLPERLGDDVEKQMVLQDVIYHLMKPWDKRTREVVLLAYYEEYSQEEISKITGMAPSTIRKYLTNFKKSAKKWRKMESGAENG